MINSTSKYSTAFTAGALLLKECNSYIGAISNVDDFLLGKEIIDQNILPINSESSRKRVKNELDKRLKSLDDRRLFITFLETDEINKKLILFYSIVRTYKIIADFMIEVVLNKWYNFDLNISVDDFQDFIFQKEDTHPELLKITDKTKYKISQVAIKMLKELELVVDGNLRKVYFDKTILKGIAQNGDGWLLETLFFNEEEQKEILEA